jgi:hypothetical protein
MKGCLAQLLAGCGPVVRADCGCSNVGSVAVSVARVIPKRIRDQQDANMSPGGRYRWLCHCLQPRHAANLSLARSTRPALVLLLSLHMWRCPIHTTQYALESALGTAAVLQRWHRR